MCPELLCLYGPFSINAYGVLIACGILVFSWFFLSDKRRSSLVSYEQYANLLVISILSAVLGGRLLYVITSDQSHSLADFLALWQGGFSVLGSLLGVLAVVPAYLTYQRIPVLPLLDIAATYAPLLQSIARLGCLCAGCCLGAPTASWAGIVFPYPAQAELQGIAVHPTPLYSSGILFLIFLFMFFIVKPRYKKVGTPVFWYLICMSIERFSVDFWRSDREFLSFFSALSIMQLIALSICVVSIIIMVIRIFTRRWQVNKR